MRLLAATSRTPAYITFLAGYCIFLGSFIRFLHSGMGGTESGAGYESNSAIRKGKKPSPQRGSMLF